MRSLLRWQYLIPLLLVPLLLLVAGIASIRKQRESGSLVRETAEVRLATSRFLSTLVDAESEERGYIATGDRAFLGPFGRAAGEWRVQLDRVRALTSDNPRQQRRLAGLESLSVREIDQLEQAMARFEAGADRDELAERLRQSSAWMNAVRSLVDDVDAEEAQLLLSREQVRQARAFRSVLLVVVGGVAYVVVAVSLVLLRRSVRAERQRAQERAERLRFSEEFISVLGHDLRNPLSTIMLAAERLLRTGAAEGQRRDLERVLRCGERMDRMISQLLDLARARLGGGLPVRPTSMSISDVVANVVDEVLAAHPGRKIECNVARDVRGEWDPDRVAQLVSNLLVNALDHGDPKRPPLVSLASDEARTELSVCSFGEPIGPDLIPHVFEPYRRGKEAPSKGLGLGLFIAQQIALAHGGTIAVQSTREEGTRFTVTLPRRKAVAPRPLVTPQTVSA